MPSAIETPLSTDRLETLPRLVPRKKKTPPAQNPLPVPETPTLPPPPDVSSLHFVEPIRRILSPKDHALFLSSSPYNLILAFVFSLSESAVDRKISVVPLASADPIIHKTLAILDSIDDTVSSYPPSDQGNSRFGNPAFRQFFDSITTQSKSWHDSLNLPSPSSIIEVSTYLHHSFWQPRPHRLWLWA